MDISQTLIGKAEQLVADEKITRIRGTAYSVVGSTGNVYSVWLSFPDEASGRCDCPSTARICPHILAASIYHLSFPPEETPKRTDDPFIGLTY